MYCKECGKFITDDAKFCSYCGTPVVQVPEEPQEVVMPATEPVLPREEVIAEPEPVEEPAFEFTRKPVFEEINWNVDEYPDTNTIGKTEDINFNWSTEPEAQKPAAPVAPAVSPAADPEPELSAAERIDRFYTFNKKNEEFQQLLNREYQKIKSGNALEEEVSKAERLAEEKFEARPVDNSMDAFLEREGIEKPYQPKPFESDVLRRIEAEEMARERKRQEEEARMKALEEARLAAEAEKLAKEEEARRLAEEEARLRAEAEAKALEEARRLAEEEARLRAEEERIRAEEARIRAEEEAKRRAEEEARLAEAEKARLMAEEKARLEAEAARARAEEEARMKAEADLKAAQEAARIRAQREARLAAEAEARKQAEEARRQQESELIRDRLQKEQETISRNAQNDMAADEARRVLAQTARMKEEEAAKIRAAIAGLRGNAGEAKAAPAKPAPAPVKPAVAPAPAPAPVKPAPAPAPVQETKAEALTSIEELFADEKLTPAKTSREIEDAHRQTVAQLNNMAKARNEFFSTFDEPAPAPAQPAKPVTGRETMLTPDDDMSKTRVIDKAAVLSGLEATRRISKSEIRAQEEQAFFASLEAEPTVVAPAPEPAAPAPEPEPVVEPAPEPVPEPVQEMKLEDLFDGTDSVESLLEQYTTELKDEPEVQEGFAVKEEPTVMPEAEASAEIKHGLDDTMIMPVRDFEKPAANDFDDYGVQEAEEYKKAQEVLEAREEIQPPAVAEPEEYDDYGEDDEEEERGGKGSVILKIILILLIIIFAAELTGIGVKYFAPNSKAAEIMNDQLNKVIHLITGEEDMQYSAFVAPERTELMENKTDLISANSDKNKNIGSIVYNSELKYDPDTQGSVTDLVLSQPMTELKWGKDKDNYPVYYDEEVIGQIIAFESARVDNRNKGDRSILDMIDKNKGRSLYLTTKGATNKPMNGDFEKLEIGEIRTESGKFLVWVRETADGKTMDKVYSMYPEKKFVLKMIARYDLD